MSELLFSVNNLEFLFPDKKKFSIPSFSLYEDQIITLFGPIGCGKTTFLKAICGIVDDEIMLKGEIDIAGKDVEKYKLHESKAILVWQDHRLFGHLSVLDNIAYPLRASGLIKEDARKEAEKILERLGFKELAEKDTISDLSGGENQIVSIARGIARILTGKCNILLLDEPFRSLEKKDKYQILDIIQDFTVKRHIGTIIVTHSPQDVLMKDQPLAVVLNNKIVQYKNFYDLLNNSKPEEILIRLGGFRSVDKLKIVSKTDWLLSLKSKNGKYDYKDYVITGIERYPFGSYVIVQHLDNKIVVYFLKEQTY